MDKLGYFMDIERFVEWTYDNSHLIAKASQSNKDKPLNERTVNKWRKFGAMPEERHINLVNCHVDGSKKFKKINIAEFLLCVNNAKDHNRGKIKKSKSVTSTGKKVLNLLLLGRMLDGCQNNNGFFTATKKIDNGLDVLTYLNSSKKERQIETYYYLPGRTVSVKQLQSVGKMYKNAIEPGAIIGGLEDLKRVGIVKCVDKEKELYKLDYSGCEKFLSENKIRFEK